MSSAAPSVIAKGASKAPMGVVGAGAVVGVVVGAVVGAVVAGAVVAVGEVGEVGVD
jgi:hypothetical protein